MNKLGPGPPLPYLCDVCSGCDLTIHASGVIENVKPAGTIGVLASVFIKRWNVEKDAPAVPDVLLFRDVSRPAPLPS